MEIDSKVKEFVSQMSLEEGFLKSVYNNAPFIPGETPVYYSGPFWDQDEIVAAVQSLLFGKWLSSGELVKKFETQFCRKFGQSFGVMVNSGSSANLVMIAALKKYYGWSPDDEVVVSVVGVAGFSKK